MGFRMASIELSDYGVRIHDLDIPRREVADCLRRVAEEDREQLLIQASQEAVCMVAEGPVAG